MAAAVDATTAALVLSGRKVEDLGAFVELGVARTRVLNSSPEEAAQFVDMISTGFTDPEVCVRVSVLGRVLWLSVLVGRESHMTHGLACARITISLRAAECRCSPLFFVGDGCVIVDHGGVSICGRQMERYIYVIAISRPSARSSGGMVPRLVDTHT